MYRCLSGSGRRTQIGRGRLVQAEAEIFPGRFPFPAYYYALVQRMDQRNCSRTGAVLNTTAAIPAFIRIENNRRSIFLRTGHQDIRPARLHTTVTACTDIRVKLYRHIRSGRIRQHIYFFSHTCFPPLAAPLVRGGKIRAMLTASLCCYPVSILGFNSIRH